MTLTRKKSAQVYQSYEESNRMIGQLVRFWLEMHRSAEARRWELQLKILSEDISRPSGKSSI